MDSGRRSNIFDVAREAQVSIKTVSRVFNEATNVRVATRERVFEAARRLNYHPNTVARSLVGRRSYLLGLFYENPSPNYVYEVQLGALERLRDERYRLIVLPVESATAVADNIVGLFHSAALDGIILTTPAADNRVILENLTAAHIPFTRIAATASPELGPFSVTDDEGGARNITDYLIGLGHRRIAIIVGDPTHASSRQRSTGYRAALAAAGIAVDATFVRQGNYDFKTGYAAATSLLDLAVRPTAIAAAHDRKLAIPGELSIVGYDDSAIAQVVYPRLTTVHQPVREMARSAADMLIAMVEKQPHAAIIEHRSYLVERDSAGPAPAA
jgi:LacI family transcriptional regulator